MPVANDNGTPNITTDDVSYLSDAEGNITDILRPEPGSNPKPEDGADLLLRYDGWGALTSATLGGATTLYAIDPLGRLISKSGATSQVLSYRGLTDDPVTSVQAGSPTTFAYGLDGASATSDQSITRVLLRDLHADVVGSTDASRVMETTRSPTR